jgi:hypothetical protein
MLTGEALEIILDMAKQAKGEQQIRYSYNLGGGSTDFTDLEKEAIEEVEFLLKSFEDTGNYTEDDYSDGLDGWMKVRHDDC